MKRIIVVVLFVVAALPVAAYAEQGENADIDELINRLDVILKTSETTSDTSETAKKTSDEQGISPDGSSPAATPGTRQDERDNKSDKATESESIDTDAGVKIPEIPEAPTDDLPDTKQDESDANRTTAKQPERNAGSELPERDTGDAVIVKEEPVKITGQSTGDTAGSNDKKTGLFFEESDGEVTDVYDRSVQGSPHTVLRKKLPETWTVDVKGVTNNVGAQTGERWDHAIERWTKAHNLYGVIDWGDRIVRLRPLPANMYRLYEGEYLSVGLQRWSRRSDHRLVYQADYDFQIQAQSDFSENYRKNVTALARSLRSSNIAVQLTLYKGNNTLRVTER